MAKKLRVGILFGGRSGEHEVSLLSAASVLGAIDREKFDVMPIGITKEGRWLAAADARGLLNGDAGAVGPAATRGRSRGNTRREAAARGHSHADGAGTGVSGRRLRKAIDVVFPVLHGTFGEDGTIQGLFELAGIAYVGSGVLGSAAGMDKDVMKRLFAQAGLPIVKHVTLLRADWEKAPRKAISAVEKALKYPVFVKPANLGSSVGISKAHDRAELGPALELAAKYDRKLIVEQGVGGKAARGGQAARAREFEVAVLGNDEPESQRGGGDHSQQGILRLRGEVSFGRVGAGDSGEDFARTKQKDSRDGRGGIQGLRSFRSGARGLSDGSRAARNASL